MRSRIPPIPLALGSTLSIAASSEHPDQAATVLDWYYSDPPRIAERIAAYPGLMTLPVPFQTSDFPADMDPRVAEILVNLGEATSTATSATPPGPSGRRRPTSGCMMKSRKSSLAT